MAWPEQKAAETIRRACQTSGFFYRASLMHSLAHPSTTLAPPPTQDLFERPFASATIQKPENTALRSTWHDLVAVTGHGLDDIIQKQFAQSATFFGQPLEVKREIAIENTRFHRLRTNTPAVCLAAPSGC